MAETIAEVRARMACRVYLEALAAGPVGAVIGTATALGHAKAGDPLLHQAADLIEHMKARGLLDVESSRHDIVRYTLEPELRRRMEASRPGVVALAERLRDRLAAFDRGEPIPPSDFVKFEALIRTGYDNSTIAL